MEKKISLTIKQSEAHRIVKAHFFTLYGGAMRGGKTWWLIIELFIYAVKYDNSRWGLFRKDMPSILLDVYPTFQALLDQGLGLYVKQWHKETHTVTLWNNSQIIFIPENYRTDKNLNRLRGLELNGAAIDEITEIQQDAFRKIIERCGTWQHSPGCPIKLLATCNPAQNWVKTLIYDPWQNNTLQDDWAFISAKISDNPYIDKELIKNLKNGLPKHHYNSIVEGDWEAQLRTGGEFLKGFDLEKHVHSFKIEDGIIHISIDSNFCPYIAVTLWQIIKTNDLYEIRQIHEILAKDPDNNATRAGELTARWLQSINYMQKSVFLYGDPTTKHRNTINENKRSFCDLFSDVLKRSGYRVEEKFLKYSPPVALVGDFINRILDGSLPFAKVMIRESCKNSIQDYNHTKQDKDGGILKTKTKNTATGATYEPNGHLLDTMKDFIIQACYNEFRQFSNKKHLFTADSVQRF